MRNRNTTCVRPASAGREAAIDRSDATRAIDLRGGVKAASTTGAVLKGLAALGGRASLAVLADRLRTHPAKLHRYLKSLVGEGLVVQEPVSLAYALGPEAIALGLAAMRQSDPIRAAEPALVRLHDTLAVGALLAVPGNRGPTIVRLVEPPDPVVVNVRPGFVMSLLWSATGRALLAASDETALFAQAQEELAAAPARRRALLAEVEPIATLVDSIRRQGGVATVRDLYLEGISAAAAPIFDFTGAACAILTILGASERLATDPDRPAVRALLSEARAVSARLGHRPADAPAGRPADAALPEPPREELPVALGSPAGDGRAEPAREERRLSMRSTARLSRRTLTSGALAAGGLLAAPALLRAQAPIELKISHYLPPVHRLHTDLLAPWAKDLEQRTAGRVKCILHPGNTAFGNITNQLDQVLAGVMDIALGLHGIPRGRFPRTGIIDMPFLTNSAEQASRILWTIYPEFLASEYKGVRVLSLFAHNPGLVHTRAKRVAAIEDLKGLRIRAPSPVVSNMLTFLGATPVGLPPGQIYESLLAGTLDGYVLPWDPVHSFKLAEVTRHHLEIAAYTVSFYIVMNERRYEALPAEVRQAIDALSGQALLPRIVEVWNRADADGKAAAQARGNEIIVATTEERARWRARLEPLVQEELARLEAQGVNDARAIYARMQELARA